MVRIQNPSLTRFLSDFTLGFSDGLTVPFALTASLNSLGRADTVIYAGLAELCAGSISMGIGGYLSAVDDVASPSDRIDGDGGSTGQPDNDDEWRAMLHDQSTSSSCSSTDRGSIDDSEKGLQSADELLVRRHLKPLALSNPDISDIVASLYSSNPDGLARAALRLRQQHCDAEALHPPFKPLPHRPVATGLSISLGYVIGGIVPLSPYFFASNVGLGLDWSIGLCLVALMAFGSGKSWLLSGKDATWWRCLLQGLQMLVLGSLAAGAAILAVNLLGAEGSPQPAS